MILFPRSTLYGGFVICIVLLVSTFSSGATLPQCTVKPDQDDNIQVSVPESLRSGFGHYQWLVEDVQMPETSGTLTLIREPWEGGKFYVVAKGPSNALICVAHLELQPIIFLDRSPFADPYPQLSDTDRTRLDVLRQVVSDENTIARLQVEAESHVAVVMQLRTKLEKNIDDRDDLVQSISDVNRQQEALANHLASVMSSMREADSRLREHCNATPNRSVCSLSLPRYASIEDQLGAVARKAGRLPPAPIPIAIAQPENVVLPSVPDPVPRDSSLTFLKTRQEELKSLYTRYVAAIANLNREDNQLRKSIDDAQLDLERQKQYLRKQQIACDDLVKQVHDLNTASAEISSQVIRECRLSQEPFCRAALVRSQIDGFIDAFPLIARHLRRKKVVNEYEAAASEIVSMPTLAKVKVFFATERERVPGKVEFNDHRSSEGTLQFGIATVTIPPIHKIGEIERPVWWKFEFRVDPKKHFTLSGTIVSESDFYQAIAQHLNDYCPHNKQVFVFVHGYNVSFDEAIFRAAQISSDIGFDGAPIVYDWPSWSRTADYVADKTAIISSVQNMETFLTEVASRTGATTINVIAHSMGNFGVLTALQDLLHTNRLPNINQLVLAAPDVDVVRMKQIIPELVAAKKIGRITLYASSKDLALSASMKVNKAAPAGRVPPVTVFSGVDTIDVSAIEGSFLGHDYFATTRPVLNDIYLLFRHGSPPPRVGLKSVIKNGITYWSLLASAH